MARMVGSAIGMMGRVFQSTDSVADSRTELDGVLDGKVGKRIGVPIDNVIDTRPTTGAGVWLGETDG